MNIEELRRRKDKGPYNKLTLNEKGHIYDKMPYVRDINICNNESIKYYSGNIVKIYQYNITNFKEIAN